jgi:hypothetical protein
MKRRNWIVLLVATVCATGAVGARAESSVFCIRNPLSMRHPENGPVLERSAVAAAAPTGWKTAGNRRHRKKRSVRGCSDTPNSERFAGRRSEVCSFGWSFAPDHVENKAVE